MAEAELNPAATANAATAAAVTAATEGEEAPVKKSKLPLIIAIVVDLISRSNDAEVAAIGAYERAHRRRRLVLEAVAARGSA